MASIFDKISVKNKIKLLRLLEANTISYKKDEHILSTMKNDNSIGIIVSGNAQIIRTDHNGIRTIIEDLEEEDIFGTVISSLKNSEYEIVTREDTTIILIDFVHIINYTDNSKAYYNQFIKNLLLIVTTKIEEKNERIAILTKKTIRNKLLEYFSIRAKKYGSKFIYLPFNFTDLADYLAIDRSAMSRELKYLKEEGFIEIKGKRITMLYDIN